MLWVGRTAASNPFYEVICGKGRKFVQCAMCNVQCAMCIVLASKKKEKIQEYVLFMITIHLSN